MPENPWNFSIEQFRERFPELSNLSDEQIAFAQELGPEYISIKKYWGRSPINRQQGIAMLVVAHLASVTSNGQGAAAGPMTSATEGSTSVSFSASASTSAGFWGLTSYGQVIWLLLRPKLTPRFITGTGRIF